MNALTIAAVNVRRLLRDRTGLFFVFVLPVVLIVVLGTMYGGRIAPRMGIVAIEQRRPRRPSSWTPSATASVKLELKEPADESTSSGRGVEDGTLEIGVIIPAGYDATLRGGGVAAGGRPRPARERGLGAPRGGRRRRSPSRRRAVGAARLAASRTGIPFDEALASRALRPGEAGRA